MHAPSLPAELIHQICDQCDRHSLAPLRLVSRDWYTVCSLKLFANLHVYSHPWLDAKRTLDLLYALAQRPTLGSYVRSVRILSLFAKQSQPCTMCKAQRHSECAGRQGWPVLSKIVADLHAKTIDTPGPDGRLAYREIPTTELWTVAGRKVITCDNFPEENKTVVMATLILALRTCVNLELLELPHHISPRLLDDQCVMEAVRSVKRLRYLIVPMNFVTRQIGYKEPDDALHTLARRSTQEDRLEALIITDDGEWSPSRIFASHWLATRGIGVVVLNNVQDRATQIDILPAFYWSLPVSSVSKSVDVVLRRYIEDVSAFCAYSRNESPAWQPKKLVIHLWPDQLVHLLLLVNAVAPVCERIEQVVLHFLSAEVILNLETMAVRGLRTLQATLEKVAFRQDGQSGTATKVKGLMLAAKRVGFDKLSEVHYLDGNTYAGIMAALICRPTV